MASFRKRHREEPATELRPADVPPVEAAAVSHALARDGAAAETSPSADAARSEVQPAATPAPAALVQRIAEMERAEEAQALLRHQLEQAAASQQQPQQPTVEDIIANAPLPERAKSWLREHPDYILDQAKNAKLQELHFVAKYQSGEEFTDAYFDRMEELLELSPERANDEDTTTVVNAEPAPMTASPQPQRRINVPQFATGPRPAAASPAPPPQPVHHHAGVAPMSAPVSREPPASNGRRLSTQTVRLSADQREIAAGIAASKGISIAQAETEYAQNLIRMQRLKAAGQLQDG